VFYQACVGVHKFAYIASDNLRLKNARSLWVTLTDNNDWHLSFLYRLHKWRKI